MIDFDDLNLKIPLVLAILVSKSSLTFMTYWIEYEESCITLGPGQTQTNLLFC